MTPEEEQAERDRLRIEFGRNRRLAHQAVFKSRHPLATPAFHHELVDIYHSRHPRTVIEGFRDSAKSTVAEEALVLMACYGEFGNAVIVGSSYTRACERLEAVKNEIALNPVVEWLFGKQEGTTWGQGKIVLANGVCIQALGSGMSMRGTKHLDKRPDFALIDDLEDDESTRTPEARDQKMRWLYKTFIPALAKVPLARIRFVGNRLDEDAVIVRLSKDPGWHHKQVPIMVQHESGVERFDLPPGRWVPMWQEKFPLADIAKMRAEYERQGLLHEFNCEYMCLADDPSAKVFSSSDIKNAAHVRTWQATFAAYDPARTVGQKSAMTGVAVFSWVGSKLIVWRGDAKLWLPDEIIEDMFDVDQRYGPVELGVEATGLEEFIMQPLRHRALQRRQLLPLRRLVPPRGKDSFIRSLQPFFKAGEVEFVDVAAEARGQLLSFPTGRKDFPNALAYALMMRPGLPVYEDFGNDHVRQDLLRTQDKYWLILNATHAYTTGQLVQLIGGQIRAHMDWVFEGPPAEHVADIAVAGRLDADRDVSILVAPVPAGTADTVGLRVAVRAAGLQSRTGGGILQGREALRDRLTRRRRGEVQLIVAASARWTLNAFSGGYAWRIDKRGQIEREPVDGPYRVLMEGLESFAAALSGLAPDEDARMAVASDGRAYRTAHPALALPQQELKIPGHG